MQQQDTLADTLPTLGATLADAGVSMWDTPGAAGLAAFRSAGGPGLLIGREHGGGGADLPTAVRVQRAIGALSPSLAVATTVHHVAVATLIGIGASSGGAEWMLLAAIARNRLIVGSGPVGDTEPGMSGSLCGGTVVLNGSRRPCGLARSMDLFTVPVAIGGDGAETLPAVAVIPARTAGISVRRFHSTPGFAGVESDEVVLDDVEVPVDFVVRTEPDHPETDDTLALAWFHLLLAASYLGAATAVANRLGPAVWRHVEEGFHHAAAQLDTTATALAAPSAPSDPLPTGDHTAECREAVRESIAALLRALDGHHAVPAPATAYLTGGCRALANGSWTVHPHRRG